MDASTKALLGSVNAIPGIYMWSHERDSGFALNINKPSTHICPFYPRVNEQEMLVSLGNEAVKDIGHHLFLPLKCAQKTTMSSSSLHHQPGYNSCGNKGRLLLLGMGLIILANHVCQVFQLRGYNMTTAPLLMQLGYENITSLLMISPEVGTPPQDGSIKLHKSSKPRKTVYYYDEPEQENENVFQGIKARAFEPWEGPVPCYQKIKQKETTHGFLFLKTYKTGSTTTLGVQMSIAKNVAKRNKEKFPMCHGAWCHQLASRGFPKPNRTKSFLWTSVRDPTSRLVSSFFFHYVSRLKQEPLDHVFIKRIRQNEKQWLTNHYMYWLSLKPYMIGKTDPVDHANSIMSDYNFMAVTERMDESMVALALILGLPLSDVLYMNGAKGAGGFDDGLFNNKCTWIAPSFISPGIEEYFKSSEYQELVRYDHAIHQAANRSLDLTIDRLGRDRFEQHLALYKEARKLADEECLPETVFPCSTDGNSVRGNKTSCMWTDAGCGYKCMDQIAARLGIDHMLS